jgi:hypothetical protein
MISNRMRSRRRSGRTGRRIDERNRVVCFICVLDICVAGSEGLRVVLLLLLLLALGFLLFVQFSLVLLVFRYAGLQGIG